MVDYEAALEYLGSFGKYQKLKFAMLFVMQTPVAFHMLAMSFLAAKVDHHCALPGMKEAGFEPQDSECALNFSIPLVYNEDKDDWEFSQCTRYSDVGIYSLGNLSCPYFADKNETGERSATKCDQGWWYDRTQYHESIFTEFDLVCEKKAMSNIAQALYMLGVLLGSVGFGQLSDIIGRKKTLLPCLVLQIIFGVATAFAPDLTTFIIFRLIVGAACLGSFLSAYVAVTEMVGTDKRTLVATWCQISFAFGLMIMALLAYLLRSWRHLQLTISLINIPMLPLWWFMIESPRWLQSQGRDEEVERIIREAAKVNGVVVPESVFTTKKAEPKEDTGKYTVLDLVRTPNMRKRSIVIFFNWLVITMVYYGLGLNTSSLGGNDYINFALAGLVEIPALIGSIYATDYFGRRYPHSATLVLGGIACLFTPYLAPPYVAKHLNPLSITLAMVGKFAVTASFNIIYFWTAEMYPTVVRNVGVGTSSMWARVGGVISPFVLLSDTAWGPLPYLIFGVLSMTAGAVALLLPETLGVPLPDTLEEGEHFRRKKPNPPRGKEVKEQEMRLTQEDQTGNKV
ncbi:organic cation transporter protein-like [Branchiostoma floridae]|uniref:Organic cation transporter protein-like n=1 Tax=Branchiostoma floridae TaxID=7739 RepID=A0A9J7LBB1_BRAFL|nr:organic cation transporter protein-like [Branchiostoma floridae]